MTLPKFSLHVVYGLPDLLLGPLSLHTVAPGHGSIFGIVVHACGKAPTHACECTAQERTCTLATRHCPAAGLPADAPLQECILQQVGLLPVPMLRSLVTLPELYTTRRNDVGVNSLTN
jgi:hypothetical protein